MSPLILSVLNAHVIRLEQRFLWHPISEKPSLEAGAFSFSARFMSRTTLSLRIAIKTKSGVLSASRSTGKRVVYDLTAMRYSIRGCANRQLPSGGTLFGV